MTASLALEVLLHAVGGVQVLLGRPKHRGDPVRGLPVPLLHADRLHPERDAKESHGAERMIESFFCLFGGWENGVSPRQVLAERSDWREGLKG